MCVCVCGCVGGCVRVLRDGGVEFKEGVDVFQTFPSMYNRPQCPRSSLVSAERSWQSGFL